jgi:Zn-dependent peptidase ImmA (M78 family)
LHEQGIKNPPVDVAALACGLGLRIFSELLPEDISGILDLRDPGKPIIMVNSEHHQNRRRFSIAHEIGHFMLHKPLGIHVDKQTFFRSPKSAESPDEYEIDANKFAAALLMPDYLISQTLDMHADWLDSNADIISDLSEQFQVSVTAMSYRLQNLGYLPRH